MSVSGRILKALVLCIAVACSGATASEGGGSETNWLRSCESTAECVVGVCVCGQCTRSCQSLDDCAAPFAPAICRTSTLLASCDRNAHGTPAAVCVAECQTANECGEGFVCSDGACERDVVPATGGAGGTGGSSGGSGGSGASGGTGGSGGSGTGTGGA